MNEIKKCSISGVGFTFEKAAYNRLNEYLQSLKEAYRNNADSEEILADIEARIAELILSAQSDAQNVVCLPLVENIIAQLGSAEEISDDEAESKTTAEYQTRIPRRLYRDLENAKLGGVCAGLARHFDVDAVWVRLSLFLPILLLFVGNLPHMYWSALVGQNLLAIVLLAYVVMWFAVPASKSARQKLEAEGEHISAQKIASRQGATDEERAKFTHLLSTGFTDTFRYFYPDQKEIYSWWSYRFKAREKNAGWRIDYFVTSASLNDKLVDAKIHTDVYGSDHCPVELTMDL